MHTVRMEVRADALSARPSTTVPISEGTAAVQPAASFEATQEISSPEDGLSTYIFISLPAIYMTLPKISSICIAIDNMAYEILL